MTCTDCPHLKTYYEPDEHFGTSCYRPIPDCRLGRDEGECELTNNKEVDGEIHSL